MSTDLHPEFPVVSGDIAMTTHWRVNLPEQFNRRIEEGSLVLWRPELTFWINVWNNDLQASVDDLLSQLLEGISPERRDEQVEKTDTVTRLTYELAEDDSEGSQSNSINAYVISEAGYVQISAYFDSPQARSLACKIIHSVRMASH